MEQETINFVINAVLWIVMCIFIFGAIIVYPLSILIHMVRLKFVKVIGNIFGWGINVIIVITCAYFLAERGALYI